MKVVRSPQEHEMQRRLLQFEETKRWTHHVIDLQSAQVSTSELDRPIAPLSRVERITRLGLAIDPATFEGPSYVLTPRTPYQPAPTAGLLVTGALTYSSWGDKVWWAQPETPDGEARTIKFFLSSLPVQPSIASVSLVGYAHPGVVGQVVASSNLSASTASFPIGDVYATHTVDFVVLPRPVSGSPGNLELSLALQPGIHYLGFEAFSFYPASPPAML